MEEQQTPAPSEAGEIVVPTEDGEAPDTSTPEAAESTDGTPEDEAPASEDVKASEEEEDRKSPSKERRERRKRTEEERNKRLAQAEKDRERADRELREMREWVQQQPEPTLDQYNGDFDKWNAALVAYHAAQGADQSQIRRLEAEAKARHEEIQQYRAQAAAEAEVSWNEQVAEARTKYPDFEALVLDRRNPDPPHITAEMAEVLKVSEHGADVAYHLAKNPDLSDQIAAMPPLAAARALGLLEAELSAPKPKPVSAAPDPIAPVKGKATPQQDPSKMTAAEFAKWREKGGTFSL